MVKSGWWIPYLCERVDLNHGGVLAEEEVVQVEQNLRHLVLLGRADAQLHSHALDISKNYCRFVCLKKEGVELFTFLLSDYRHFMK
jgi:hypothetical protein